MRANQKLLFFIAGLFLTSCSAVRIDNKSSLENEPEPSDEFEEGTESTQTTGTALSVENARILCTTSFNSTSRTITSECKAMAEKEDGSLVEATEVETGVTVAWSDPVLSSLSNSDLSVEYQSCQISSNGLAQNCLFVISLNGTGSIDDFDIDFIFTVTNLSATATVSTAKETSVNLIGGGAQGIYSWTNTIGGANQDAVRALTFDSSGNLLLASGSQVTADFDPSADVDNFTSNGSSDLYISKFQADGSYLWTKGVGGNYGDYANAITTDSNESIYIAGYFESDSVDFDPSAGVDTITRDGGSSSWGNFFLMKILSDGTYSWTKELTERGSGGMTGNAMPNCMASDSSNNIFVAGHFDYSVDFDPTGGVDSRSAVAGYDMFIMKFQSDGTLNWTKTIGGSQSDIIYGAVMDSNDNLYITGYFQDTVDFDPSAGTDNHVSNGNGDIFISKFQSDGTYLWTKTMGGSLLEVGVSIAVDGSNNLYISGYFNGTVDFDPSAGTDNHTSLGGVDAFFTKLDSDGGYLWTKTFGGTGSDVAYSAAADANGNAYVISDFSDTVDFDPTAGTDSFTSNGVTDISVSKYKTDGTYEWTKVFGGTGDDRGKSIVVNSNGLYIGGAFQNVVDFNPSGIKSDFTSSGSYDIYLTKFY